jgi:hypothetical protein
MTLLDLSQVTKSLLNLIEEGVKASSEWSSSAQILNVSPQPPDELKANNKGNTLGFYLYHISEDPHFKNLPSPGSDTPPIRYTPMGLTLHYQLTAYTDDHDSGALQEQLMMGLAIKTLHDYPMIDGSTQIVDKKGETKKILDSHLDDGNRFRISMLPLPFNEAVSYWTAGSIPLRLAAYYEVSVVLLEPEEIQSRAGRVLTYDVFSFLEGAPRLFFTYNTISFSYPPGGTTSRELTLQPAEVTYGEALKIKGTALSAQATSLLISTPRWDNPVEADSAWAVVAKAEELSATVQTTVAGRTLLPGIYSAQAKVSEQRTVSDGSVRVFEKLSNIAPFTVAPKVDPLDIPDPQGVLAVSGSILQHTHLHPENVSVFIGETRLAPGTWGSLNQGEFADLENLFSIDPTCDTDLDANKLSVKLGNEFKNKGVTLSAKANIAVEKAGEKWRVYDADSEFLVRRESGALNVYAVTRLQLRLPGGLTPGACVPFRLIINGAESHPRWVQVPK